MPTALTLNGFSRTGYVFSGWNTVAIGGGTPYTDGATYPSAPPSRSSPVDATPTPSPSTATARPTTATARLRLQWLEHGGHGVAPTPMAPPIPSAPRHALCPVDGHPGWWEHSSPPTITGISPVSVRPPVARG